MPTKKIETENATEMEVATKKIVRKRAVKKEADETAAADAEEAVAAEVAEGGSFIPAVGRRKRAIARIRLVKNGKGMITINGKKMEQYFSTYDLREQVVSPLKAVGQDTAVDVSAKVNGGGILGQAQAIRMGVSRALIELNPVFRTALKKMGFLTRDSRKRERKKFGHKSARRSPQWSKR